MGVLPDVRRLRVTDLFGNTVILIDVERGLLKSIARIVVYFHHIT
jgi:hypothetical protein